MANLMSLPTELISHILMQENIDIEDIANLSSTCRQLYTAIRNDCLWRRKFFQRWPSLKKTHPDHLNNDENIKEMVKKGMKYDKELSYCLSILPYIYNAKDSNVMFNENIRSLLFTSVTAEDTFSLKFASKYCYFHDKLNKLMEADPLDKHINLTDMYYAKKFIVQMKHINMSHQWYNHLSDKQQTVEKVATLVAQWCQPYKLVLHCDVAASLDNIVQQVLKILKDVYPAHSIFAISAEQFSFWKNNNIKDNYWNVKESRQIIDIIGRVIFHELNFNIRCVNSDETCIDPKIIFIDQVLESKRASPILLEIIIQSVARRLGVRCDLLYSPSHLFLSWRESYKNGSDFYYIDLFSDGSLISKKDCLRYRPHEIDTHMSHMERLFPTELVLHLTTNLDIMFSRRTYKYFGHTNPKNILNPQICWMSQLVHMVKRSSDFARISFWPPIFEHFASEFCFPESSEIRPDCWPNTREEDPFIFGSIICTDYENTPKKKIKPNKSNSADSLLSKLIKCYRLKIQSRLTRKHLKYTIGMLVEIESPFKTAGVITGWTSKCSNCHHYLSWPRFDHVSEPTMCTQNYTILACDDRELNVSQEFLKPLKMQKWINNTEIGQYFSHFEGTHYVPNQKLQMLYPMDVNILERKYSKS